MVLVGEIEELAGHPLALQRREGRDPLLQRHAEVLSAVDHQHRRPPLRHVQRRVVPLVALRVPPVGAAVLPLGKPQLLGRVVHHPLVEHAVVVHQAAEALGPVTGDPVDHVTAVRRAQGAGPLAVHPGIALEGRGQTLLQIDQRLAAPVAPNRVGERLPVAGGAVEIDHDRGVAGGGVDLRVPAVVEVVVERALRAPVDQKGEGVFPGRIEIGRLDQPGVDRLVVPPLEGELLRLSQTYARQLLGVDPRDRPHVRTVAPRRVQLHRRAEVIEAEDDAVAGVGRRADVAVAAQRPHLSAAHVDGEQADVAQVAGRDQERPTVRRPGHRAR